jgi:hypothetical protein
MTPPQGEGVLRAPSPKPQAPPLRVGKPPPRGGKGVGGDNCCVWFGAPPRGGVGFGLLLPLRGVEAGGLGIIVIL